MWITHFGIGGEVVLIFEGSESSSSILGFFGIDKKCRKKERKTHPAWSPNGLPTGLDRVHLSSEGWVET